jgi:ABC-type transport system substrate-binding protein
MGYPAFEITTYPNGVANLKGLYTWVPGTKRNYIMYSEPEFLSLVDRLYSTIPWSERMEVLGRIVHQFSDQLPSLGLFYDSEATVVAAPLVGATARGPVSGSAAWNAHEWEAT